MKVFKLSSVRVWKMVIIFMVMGLFVLNVGVGFVNAKESSNRGNNAFINKAVVVGQPCKLSSLYTNPSRDHFVDGFGSSGYAVDLRDPSDECSDNKLLASISGKVSISTESVAGCSVTPNGNVNTVLKITNNDGISVTYRHQNPDYGSFGISEGTNVVEGQELATMGMIGCATGIHIHFEVYENNTKLPYDKWAFNLQDLRHSNSLILFDKYQSSTNSFESGIGYVVQSIVSGGVTQFQFINLPSWIENKASSAYIGSNICAYGFRVPSDDLPPPANSSDLELINSADWVWLNSSGVNFETRNWHRPGVITGYYSNKIDNSIQSFVTGRKCSGASLQSVTPRDSNCFGGPTNTNTPCAGQSNGLYCGGSLGLDQNKLYSCYNGSYSYVQTCSNTCVPQPSGVDDYCAAPPTNGSCPNNQNGHYCGKALGLDENKLYNCQNGNNTVIQTCALGCLQKPPGTNDVCKTTPGGSCPNGNGDYCGHTLGLDPNTLYTCTNGNSSVKQVCNNGCKINAPGQPDACYPPGSGGGGNTGEKVTLYGNSNYDPSSIRIQVGTGDSEEPTRGAWYKSMSIPNGWSVILSDQHLGLVGNTICFNQSVQNMEVHGGWANSIESMKVYSSNVCPSGSNDWVKICSQTGYWGDHPDKCITVNLDIPKLSQIPQIGNDNLRSINVGGAWEVVLFEDDNYGGRRYTTNGTNDDLGGIPFGYGTSSIQVRRRSPEAFKLYKLGDYNDGNPFSSDRTVENLSFWDTNTDGGTWNDKAHSMRVGGGYEVVACVEAGFHGNCGRTKNDVSDLNALAQGLKGGLSSVQVCLGNCPPTSVIPVQIGPVSGETFTLNTPITFSWSGNGEEYLVEYWGGGLSETQKSNWITGTAWSATGLPASNNLYNWRVKSWTTVGETNWSPVFTFKIQEPAPVQVYINGPTEVLPGTNQTYTALASPSSATNLNYNWSPTPQSGQGTANATYNFNNVENQEISVTVQNSGGNANAELDVAVGCAQGKYLAQYFNNKTLNGSPVAHSCEDKIDFNWGNGKPSQVSNNDQFSIRWIGKINFVQDATYKFTTKTDDGVKVFIDNSTTPLIEKWIDGYSINEKDKAMTEGIHKITVEYYENEILAEAHFSIQEQPPTCGTNKYMAEYYDNKDLSGDPITYSCEDKIDFNWGSDSPFQIPNNDNFGIKWTGNINFTEASLYKFTTYADDGVLLWVDDVQVIEDWSDGLSVNTGERYVRQGVRKIIMEYYENQILAEAHLGYEKIPSVPPIVSSIPDQSIDPGDTFTAVYLNQYVTNYDLQSPLTWQFSGNNEIEVEIISGNLAIIWYPQGWTGSENITFTAKNQSNQTGSDTAKFTVGTPNNPPVVSQIPGQTITQGQTFSNINLNNYVSDPGDTITWSKSGNSQINVTINNGIASFTYPNNWNGSENITFKATDSGGLNASSTANFKVNPITITCPPNYYIAQYFNNQNLSGSPTVTKCDKLINYQWWEGKPHPQINADHFSVRWSRTFNVPKPAYYQFRTFTDDGVRVYVDGVLKINNWTPHPQTRDTVMIKMAPGNHNVAMEYFEQEGIATAMMDIIAHGDCRTGNALCISYDEILQTLVNKKEVADRKR